MVSKKTIILIAFLLVTSCFVLIFIKKSITGKIIAESQSESQMGLREAILIEEDEQVTIQKNIEERSSGSRKGSEEEKSKVNYFKLENPTSRWANFYGRLIIDGKPVKKGDEIAAFDPDGVLSGVFVVKNRGYYGFLHVYADDPLTSMDEGAVPGDKITFKVFDLSRNKELIINITATWNAYENIRADLKA